MNPSLPIETKQTDSTRSESASPAVPSCNLSCSLDRRSFFQMLAASVGVALLAGCNGEKAETTNLLITAVTAGAEWKVPGAAGLKAGEALAFEFPDKTPGLVFVSKENVLKGISAKCTHSGCTVLWQESTELLCPCHGSRFDLGGRVLTGPATAPLPVYEARKQGDDVLLKAAK